MRSVLLVALLLATLFVADAAPQETSRGEWHDDVFVSEFFGLRFTLPDDWRIVDSAFMYAASPIFDDSEWFYELVMLSYQQSEMTVEDYLANILASNVAEIAGDEPLRFLRVQDYTTRIGRYDWHSFRFWGIDGGEAHEFIRVCGGYMLRISVFSGREFTFLEDILEHFSPLEQ